MHKNSYSILAKVFHWGFVILFVYGVVKQVEDITQLNDKFFFAFEIIFAIIFLTLLLIRFIYMQKTQKTSLPLQTSYMQRIAAKFVHLTMYLLLFLTAISGILIGILYWIGFKNGIFIEYVIYVHEFVVNLLYLFIFIHIIAATYHRLKKDGVWSSMVPFLKE